MVTQQLVEYIQHELQQGTSSEQIKAGLESIGWSTADIEEAYRTASTAPVAPTAPSPLAFSAKAPIVVRVISLLMFIGGAFTLLGSGVLLFATFAGGFNKTISLLVVLSAITLVKGIGYLVISFGIRRMRRWALYAFTSLAGLSMIGDIMSMGSSQRETINASVDIGINILLLIYFWSIAKKFTKKAKEE